MRRENSVVSTAVRRIIRGSHAAFGFLNGICGKIKEVECCMGVVQKLCQVLGKG